LTHTIIIGPKELRDNVLTIRDMNSGKQLTGKMEDLDNLIKSMTS
jgi:histidyl-tRNA synthetase